MFSKDREILVLKSNIEDTLKVPSQEFFYRLDRIFTPILVYKTHF